MVVGSRIFCPRLPAVLKTILIADDNSTIRYLIRFLIENAGFKVCAEAEDGRQAIEKAQQTKPDLILLDLSMPKMNGDQLAVEIKKLDPAMPVVMVTGFADLMRDVGDQPPGVDAIVRKPFTMETLREGMNKAIALHEGAVVKSRAGASAGEGMASLVSGTFH